MKNHRINSPMGKVRTKTERLRERIRGLELIFSVDMRKLSNEADKTGEYQGLDEREELFFNQILLACKEEGLKFVPDELLEIMGEKWVECAKIEEIDI